MKLDIVPESLLERALLATGAIPRPLAHTMIAMLMSRTILAAVKVGVFEALQDDPQSPESLAAKCAMDRKASDKMLRALSGLGYVRKSVRGYELTAATRRWLGSGAKSDLTHALLHRYLDMKLMDHAEEYLRSGKSIDFHRSLSNDDWRIYMNGQRVQAALTIPELVKRTPLPDGGTSMLDIGGGHGLFADAMCRKHPDLRVTVLDLPGALDASDRGETSGRIRFVQGDALETDLGSAAYDLVFAGNLLHHFDEAQIRDVIRRGRAALKPAGFLVVADFFEPSPSKTPGQVPALLDFYFAVTSGGGTLSRGDLEVWMEEAGLRRVRFVRLRSGPGMGLMIGTVE